MAEFVLGNPGDETECRMGSSLMGDEFLWLAWTEYLMLGCFLMLSLSVLFAPCLLSFFAA